MQKDSLTMCRAVSKDEVKWLQMIEIPVRGASYLQLCLDVLYG